MPKQKKTNDTEAPLSEDDDHDDGEIKKDEEQPLNDDNIKKSDIEEVDFNIGYFDERSNRFFYLSIISFFVFFNYFICQTTTDEYQLKESGERTETYLTWIHGRLVGCILICVACLGIWFLKFKQKESLNNEDSFNCGMNVHTLVGLLFIAGGISLLISTIKVVTTSLEVARESFSDENFKCGNFTKNELINYDTGELEEQNIGVNVCALPFAYDSILFLLPLIIGLDILLTKLFRTSDGKYLRISFYSLTLFGFVIFFCMFGYSITDFCEYQNKAHSAITRSPTEITISPTVSPIPTPEPSRAPTLPTLNPPSFNPTSITQVPSRFPTTRPTFSPSLNTNTPSKRPTNSPTKRPTGNPVMGPTVPSLTPTEVPSPTPTKAPTSRDELKDELLCAEKGYLNTSDPNPQSMLINPPNGLWNNSATWNFKGYRYILLMCIGAVLIGVGMLLAFIMGLFGMCFGKCFGAECCKFGCCNWKCGGRNGVGILPLLTAIILVIGSIIVFCAGIIVQENTGYIGYNYKNVVNSGGAFRNSWPYGGYWAPSLNCVFLIYGYWALIVAVCWFIAVDLLNIH